MSIVVSNAQGINNHPANSSPAKQLFSFPRTRRFREPKQYNQALCYDPAPTFKVKRHTEHVKTTFGITRPALFYSKEQAAKPAPVTYNLSSTFLAKSVDRANSADGKSEGKPPSEERTSFGAGRASYNKVVSVSGFNYLPFDLKNPGPGYYNGNITSQKHRYSMRPKTAKERKYLPSYFDF